MAMEKQGRNDPRSQPREEDIGIGYEDNLLSQTFEGLEQRFLDDIMKLVKDQADAEDAENARHREVSFMLKSTSHALILFTLWFVNGHQYSRG